MEQPSNVTTWAGFASALKERRLLASVPMADIEKDVRRLGRASVSRATLWRIMQGQSKPSRQVLLQILRSLGVSESDRDVWFDTWDRLTLEDVSSDSHPHAEQSAPGMQISAFGERVGTEKTLTGQLEGKGFLISIVRQESDRYLRIDDGHGTEFRLFIPEILTDEAAFDGFSVHESTKSPAASALSIHRYESQGDSGPGSQSIGVQAGDWGTMIPLVNEISQEEASEIYRNLCEIVRSSGAEFFYPPEEWFGGQPAKSPTDVDQPEVQ